MIMTKNTKKISIIFGIVFLIIILFFVVIRNRIPYYYPGEEKVIKISFNSFNNLRYSGGDFYINTPVSQKKRVQVSVFDKNGMAIKPEEQGNNLSKKTFRRYSVSKQTVLFVHIKNREKQFESLSPEFKVLMGDSEFNYSIFGWSERD